MTHRRSRAGRALRAMAVMAVALALTGRLASGAMVVDTRAIGDVAALLDAMIQCRSESPAAPDRGTGEPSRHGADQAILAFASVLSEPSPTLTPALPLMAPRGGVLFRGAATPPVRGLPDVPTGAALPRGPPVLA